MKRKQEWLPMLGLCAMMGVTLVGCDKNNDPIPEPQPEPAEVQRVYLLNTGKGGGNNATLDSYNPLTKVITTKVFSTANGRGLGDTGNDMLIYGSKMYIALTGSNTIEITDLNAKSLKTLSPKADDGQPQSPRQFTAYEGKVYVTLFDGHLAALDTTTLEITQKVKVGPNPEGVCGVNGKLYVANSGGYLPMQDSTLSVIDAATFTVQKETVKTIINPCTVKADRNGVLYVMSYGRYGVIPAAAQRIDPATGKIEVIESNDQVKMTLAGDQLYLLSSESNATTNWLPKNTKYIQYDTKAAKVVTENFITDGTTVSNPACISVDHRSGIIYIGSGTYTATGDMFLYSTSGKRVHNFGVSGINPMGAFVVNP